MVVITHRLLESAEAGSLRHRERRGPDVEDKKSRRTLEGESPRSS